MTEWSVLRLSFLTVVDGIYKGNNLAIFVFPFISFAVIEA